MLKRRPISVLVVVHSDDGQALLLQRSNPFEFWQSVTGSLHRDESHADAAARELREETGLTNQGVFEYSGVSRQFVIDPRWRHKFASGSVENVEFEWRYRVPSAIDIEIDAAEHTDYCWLPYKQAAEKVWSWTNRDALNGLVA